MDRILRSWEFAGFFFIFFMGALFHFVFEFSGYNSLVGLIAPVNESVWEHLKLVYFPGLMFLIIEYFFVGKKFQAFFMGKAISLYIMCGTILGGYYLYTLFIEDNLVYDIILMALSIVIGQIVSYYISVKIRISAWTVVVSWLAIIALGILFVIFTFNTPELEPFKDSASGEYGILSKYD